jgi:hypothetical protein
MARIPANPVRPKTVIQPFKVYNLDPLVYDAAFNQRGQSAEKQQEELIQVFNPHWIELNDAL